MFSDPWLVFALPWPVRGFVVFWFGVLLLELAPSGPAFPVVSIALSDSAERVKLPAVTAPVLSTNASVVSKTSAIPVPRPALPPTCAFPFVLTSVLLTALTVRSLPVAVSGDAPVTFVLAVLMATEIAIAPLPPFVTSLVDVERERRRRLQRHAPAAGDRGPVQELDLRMRPRNECRERVRRCRRGRF